LHAHPAVIVSSVGGAVDTDLGAARGAEAVPASVNPVELHGEGGCGGRRRRITVWGTLLIT